MRVCSLIPLAAVLLPIALVATPRYLPWATAVNLGPLVNSSFAEQSPTLSKDGHTLYFTSNRPCGVGDTTPDLNIWVSLAAADGAWGVPQCLAVNLEQFEDSAAALSRDEHWMFFVSSRPGGVPGADTRDLWVSWRRDVHDPNAWNEPIHTGLAANSPVSDAGPTYFENEGGTPQVFFTSFRNGSFDIFVADVHVNGQLGTARLVTELNSATETEARPSIRFDGLELFFFKGPQGGPFDIFVATRSNVSAAWMPAVPLGFPVNTAASEQQPAIASDRATLLFAANRGGGFGGLDLWAATRSKASHE